MSNAKIIVVTGANRGIGHAICKSLLSQNDQPLKLYACSRAGQDLKLNSKSVVYPKLDITNPTQINELVAQIKSTEGHVDVLINNAGLNKHGSGLDVATEIMNINYTGTLNMCRAFIPLMKSDSRIVNVSSTASTLGRYDAQLQSKFRDPDLTTSDVDDLAKTYLEKVASGKVTGWGDDKGYCFSKACVNAITAILARQNPELVINACCPGWVDTEMGKIVGQPSKTPEEGARIPVRLAVGDIEGVSGRYWGNPGVNDTGHGRVLQW